MLSSDPPPIVCPRSQFARSAFSHMSKSGNFGYIKSHRQPYHRIPRWLPGVPKGLRGACCFHVGLLDDHVQDLERPCDGQEGQCHKEEPSPAQGRAEDPIRDQDLWDRKVVGVSAHEQEKMVEIYEALSLRSRGSVLFIVTLN